SAIDPDGDDVYFMFDWGDDTTSGWVGPYNSGQTGSAKKTWTSQGTYTVKVVAKDEHGKFSSRSDPLEVSMPRNRAFFNSIILEILDRILERFPLLEQILASRPIIGGLLDI
ncbi:MAG: PKD domain-containing protein, partial [Thermoplasmatales archaeon]